MRENVIVAYRGANYELGQWAYGYGIWRAADQEPLPLEWWDPTTEGWSAAWYRFAALEVPGTITPVSHGAGGADIIEAFNAKIEDQARNDRAAQLAARFGLAAGAGSDAHDPDGIGAAYLEMPDFGGPRSFLTSLREAVITGEYRPHAIRYAPRPT